MIESFSSGTPASQVAKNGTKKLSQLFEELQGSNSEFKLITPKPIIGTISIFLTSSTNASLVAKNGTKNFFSCLKSYKAQIQN